MIRGMAVRRSDVAPDADEPPVTGWPIVWSLIRVGGMPPDDYGASPSPALSSSPPGMMSSTLSETFS